MLISLENGWYSFSGGKRWRILPPEYFCEVEEENNIPSYLSLSSTLSKMKRIKSFYQGRLNNLGQLDEKGTGIDILVANAMTESLGTVPSPLEYSQLREIYEKSSYTDEGDRLDEIVKFVASYGAGKYLQRCEPGYINPIVTPSRISLGSHHILLSTALTILNIAGKTFEQKEIAIRELCFSLPSQSIKAAELAASYLNRYYSKHFNHLPLIAATYNAGSPRYTTANEWHLVQYGQHIDRWIAYYNTSRYL
jgi:hypothetical protein